MLHRAGPCLPGLGTPLSPQQCQTRDSYQCFGSSSTAGPKGLVSSLLPYRHPLIKTHLHQEERTTPLSLWASRWWVGGGARAAHKRYPALFPVAKKRGQPQYPSAHKWINKMRTNVQNGISLNPEKEGGPDTRTARMDLSPRSSGRDADTQGHTVYGSTHRKLPEHADVQTDVDS